MEMTNKQLEVENFIPQKIGDKYITFLVELSLCFACKRSMIRRPKNPTEIFPYWNKITFDAQVEKSNLVIRSNVLVDDYFICVECVKNGKADFLCALCETRKTTDKIYDWIGSPAEFLCRDCFESVSAAVWAAKVNDLHEAHRYDEL